MSKRLIFVCESGEQKGAHWKASVNLPGSGSLHS